MLGGHLRKVSRWVGHHQDTLLENGITIVSYAVIALGAGFVLGSDLTLILHLLGSAG
jgi:hypothetical protein